MKRFNEALKGDEFIITGELSPPKGTRIDEFIRKAKRLKDMVHAINVTDNQSAVMRLSSLVASYTLLKEGIDPIYQLTCRDRNRLALQSDLLGASMLGINYVLALTGDHPKFGDHKGAKPVFDVDSIQLLGIINNLNNGRDLMDNLLEGKTSFIPGAVVSPENEPLEVELIRFEKKIKAGARFFQTQAIFDIKRFETFMDYAKKYKVKILAGILLLKSDKMARYVNRHIPGIRIPEKLIAELEKAPDKLKKGIEISIRELKEIKGLAHGVHLMTMNNEENLLEILKGSGI